MSEPQHLRAESGLSLKEELFCRWVSQGYSQTEAYKRAYKPRGKPDTDIGARASGVAAKARIQDRVRALLREAKLQDLDSIAQYHQDLARQIKKAEDEGNLTALAALMRLRGQTLGALQERQIVTDERSKSDEELIARLAKDRPVVAQRLRELAGSDEAYDA